jgi:hypothetical protein
MGRPPAAIDRQLLELLTDTYSDEEIGLKLGFARVSVTGARKRFGIPSFFQKTDTKRRKDGQRYAGGRYREHHFNESFFEELSTEAQAYYLGLLAADGSIDEIHKHMEVTLAEPDHHILEEFLEHLEADGPTVKARRRPNRVKTMHRLTLSSKKLVQDLAAWGLVQGKTYDFRLAKEVPDHLKPHFVRGFWDGDGSIGKRHFEVGIKSTAFTLQFKAMIEEIGGQSPNHCVRTTKDGKPFHVFSVASSRFRGFRLAIYGDASVCLARKKESFLAHWC